jgi:DnaJ-like protein
MLGPRISRVRGKRRFLVPYRLKVHNRLMKFDSPIFDKIRVKPEKDRTRKKDIPACEWAGCKKPGGHRAPKGREGEKSYWNYCLEHVREYNHAYNYFAGMSNEDIAKHQKDALTGHRPTWKMNQRTARSADERRTDGSPMSGRPSFADPFSLFAEQSARNAGGTEQRTVRNVERKALATLGLEVTATSTEIKTRFKELVKRHHPDANHGDKSTEDVLRGIIEAYNYLKSAGFC